MTQSTVPRPRVTDKRKRRTFTATDALMERISAVAEAGGLSVASVVERCILRALPAFEADSGELMRPSPPPNHQEPQ